jgi:diguanylate cyclase
MYEEDDRDVNVLKTVLPLMSRHAAGYHPISYAVWYEYAKGTRPAIRQSVDDELKRQQRLSVAQTYSVYSKHVVDPAEQALITARTDLMGLVGLVSRSVERADRDTAAFDTRLTEFQHDLAHATTIEDLSRHVSGMIVVARRLGQGFGKLSTELEQSRIEVLRLTEEMQRIRGELLTDSLSGLLNRRGFDQELQMSARKEDEALAVIMLDIDHFKKVNDTYGRTLGDRVIAAIARFIHDCLGDMGTAARYGGEQFAVIMRRQPIEAAEGMAQLIRERVGQGKIRRRQEEEPIDAVTVSAGVAAWRFGEDLASLMERAERALQASKRNGRNRVTVDDL